MLNAPKRRLGSSRPGGDGILLMALALLLLAPLPVTFPLVMAFGGFLGLVGVPLPGVEVGVDASAILLGALVAAEARPPLWLGAAVVGFFAVFHGHAHGAELPAGHRAPYR